MEQPLAEVDVAPAKRSQLAKPAAGVRGGQVERGVLRRGFRSSEAPPPSPLRGRRSRQTASSAAARPRPPRSRKGRRRAGPA
jgi:hypothetical protein